MKTTFIATLSTIITMLAIDAVWLKTMFPIFYTKHIGDLVTDTPKLAPAGIFYLIFAVGLTVFVLLPSITQSYSISKIFVLGALFGLVAYSTYDLTNQATIKDWPTIVTLVDLAWGTLLTGTVSVIAVSITKYFS